MATLWERTPQRLPPAEPLPLRGDSSEGFQGFFSEFCSEKATSSPVFMRELPTVADMRERRRRASSEREIHSRRIAGIAQTMLERLQQWANYSSVEGKAQQ